jgi:oligopeptide transport system substrate-binding protein
VKKKAKWSIFISVLLIVSLFLAACSGGTKKTDGESKGKNEAGNAPEQVLNLASSADIPSLDIGHATDSTSFDALYMIQSGLMTVYDGKTVPDLSDGMPTVSDDGKTYTFKLRDGIKWSDGSPVTAQDFVYAWHRELDPKTAAEYAYVYESANIKNASKILDPDSDLYGKVDQLGVKALDDKTLQVTLEEATPYFLSLMGFPPFFPLKQEFVEKQGDNYAKEPENMLFNGAYKLQEWKHGEGWTLVKNPDYWDAKNITIDKVVTKVVKDVTTRLNLYLTDKIQAVGLTEEYVDKYKDNPEFQTIPGNCVFYMKLNIDKIPAFQNIKVRQAMSMAVDREGLVNTLLNNGSVPAHFFVPKKFTFGPDGKDFRDAAPDGYLKGSKEEAKRLWEEAKKELGIKELNLEYLTTDSPTAEKFAEYNANQISTTLKGIHFKMNRQPWSNYLELSKGTDFDVSAGSSWCPDYQDPTTFLDLWTTGNMNNSGKWNDKHYDQLMAEAKALGNKPAERWAKLQEAEKYLIEQAPMIPIYQSGSAILTKPYVKNLIYANNGPGTDFRHAKVEKH